MAAWLDGRTSQDCLVKWRYSINPTIRRGKWSAEEDVLLRQARA